MALDLMGLVARLGLDKSEYEQGMKDAEGGFKNFGSNLKKGVANVAKIAAGAATAAAGAFTAVTAAVTKGVSEVAAYGDNIDKASQKLGISAKAYQEWDAVMQHSGTSIDSMGIGMKTLSTKAQEGSKAFKKLGISQKEAAKMSREELFSRTITALQGVQDANKKAQLAQELFGKSAMELGPLLNTTAEDTQAMKDQVNALGGVLSDEAVKASAAYQDTLQDMTTAMDGVKRGVFASFLPSVTMVMQGITDMFTGSGGAGKIRKGVNEFITNMGKTLPGLLKKGLKVGSAVASAVVNAIPDVVRRVSSAIPTAVSGIWNTAKNVLMTQGVQSIARFLNQLITGGADKSFSSAQQNIQFKLTHLFKNVFEIGGKIVDNAKEMWNSFIGVIEDVIQPALQNLVSFLVNDVLPIVNSFLDLINDGLSAIPSIVGDLVDAVKQGDWAKAGSIIWDAIKSGFKAVNGWLLKLVLGKDYTPESGWGDVGSKIWNAIKTGFAVVNGWLIKLLMGDEWTPESGWGDVGAKIWTAIKNGFAVVNGWLLKLVLGDDYTPESGWGDVGGKMWGAIKNGFAVANDWLIKLLMGDDYTPEAGWGDVGSRIWGAIKNGFAVTNDWLKKLLIGEDEYTPEDSWATVGSKIWGKIIEGLGSAVDWLTNLLTDWTDKLKGGDIDFGSIGYTIGNTIFGAITNAVKGIVDWFKNLFGGKSDSDETSVKGAIYSIDWAGLGTAIYDFIGAAFSGIVQAYKGYFQGAWDAIKEIDWAGLGESMWGAITDAFSSIASWFEDTFSAPINIVIGYINDMIGHFENAFNRVISSVNYLLGTNFEQRVFARVQEINKSLYGEDTVRGGGAYTEKNAGTGRRSVRGYASGGILREGQLGIVGEYAPEFLQVIGGKAVVTPMNTGRFPGGGQEVVVPRNQSRDITIILELDRQQFGKAVYKANNDETQRVGVRMATGGAY